MRVLIVAGGTVDEEFLMAWNDIHPSDAVIAADRGVGACFRMGLDPQIILGDFDSADSYVLEYYKRANSGTIRQFEPEKDETDSELAVAEAIALGATEIMIAGATGTRIDHVLGNIELLKYCLDCHVDCCLIDPNNRIRLIDKELWIGGFDRFGSYLSLIPFHGDACGVTLEGFKYPLTDATMVAGSTLGISNEITGESASITMKSGMLLVIESQD